MAPRAHSVKFLVILFDSNARTINFCELYSKIGAKLARSSVQETGTGETEHVVEVLEYITKGKIQL